MNSKVLTTAAIFIFGMVTISFGQKGYLRVTDLNYEKVTLYGCNNALDVSKGQNEFVMNNCDQIDSIRLQGKDELFFKDYQWHLDGNEALINISLSYVDIENSYSIIFHNENSVAWLVYELNGDNEWNSLIIPNCEGDNSHKQLKNKIEPIAHVPDEYMHK